MGCTGDCTFDGAPLISATQSSLAPPGRSKTSVRFEGPSSESQGGGDQGSAGDGMERGAQCERRRGQGRADQPVTEKEHPHSCR